MFEQRREILFLYTVKDANPNGDPLNANHPRYDEETGQIMVSDVRTKRTIRDELMNMGEPVLIDGEAATLVSRYNTLKKLFGTDDGVSTLKRCIDTRLFGATFAVGKESFSWTGPVQFKWGRSLHRAKVEFVQGTAAFSTREDSQQRSFRNEYIVPFALIASSAICNQNASLVTETTDQDLDKMIQALWQGTKNLITRSKMEHRPVFMLEIRYTTGCQSHIGNLDELVFLSAPDGSTLSSEKQLQLRSLREMVIDLSNLQNRLQGIQNHIDSVRIIADEAAQLKGMTETIERR